MPSVIKKVEGAGKIEEIAGKVLGVRLNDYKTTYDPSLLVPVPRKLNREQYGIENENLPFKGWDVWHIYEVSFLTEKGLPVLGVGKLMYPADSELFIESKSLKLYFYSLNMMKYGCSVFEGCLTVEAIVRQDIAKALKIPADDVMFMIHLQEDSVDAFKDFKDISSMCNLEENEFTEFKEAPSLLESTLTISNLQIHRDLKRGLATRIKIPFLRSNCRVTHQPDYGTMYISVLADEDLDLTSLAKYIVSFRNEFHFHEEVVEMVYKRLWDKLKPIELFVGALYTRRGGLDICPMRYTNINLCPEEMLDVYKLTKKTLNQ